MTYRVALETRYFIGPIHNLGRLYVSSDHATPCTHMLSHSGAIECQIFRSRRAIRPQVESRNLSYK